MIIKNNEGQNVAYVSDEYLGSYTDDPKELEVLSLMFQRMSEGVPQPTNSFLEKIGAKPKSANTPRKKVKEETTYGTPLWLVKAIEEDFQLNFTFDLAADEASYVTREKRKEWENQVKELEPLTEEQMERIKRILRQPRNSRIIVHDGSMDKGYYNINDNSLEQDWNNLSGDLWLNPPFANIKAWAAKCETYQNGTICMLVPASLGSSWFRSHCMGRPVYILDTRIMFDGHTDPYPKDLMLVFFKGGQKDFEISGPFSRFSINSYSIKHAIPKKERAPLGERLKKGLVEAIEAENPLFKLTSLSEEYDRPD